MPGYKRPGASHHKPLFESWLSHHSAAASWQILQGLLESCITGKTMTLKPACRTSVKSRLKYVWFVSCRILQKYSWELRFLNLSMFSQKPIFFSVKSFRKRFSGFLVWLWKLISNFLTFNMIFIFSSIPAVWSVIYGQTLQRDESIK